MDANTNKKKLRELVNFFFSLFCHDLGKCSVKMQKRQQYEMIIVRSCLQAWVIKKLKEEALNLFGAIIV